jgi:hypothetical protein
MATNLKAVGRTIQDKELVPWQLTYILWKDKKELDKLIIFTKEIGLMINAQVKAKLPGKILKVNKKNTEEILRTINQMEKDSWHIQT